MQDDDHQPGRSRLWRQACGALFLEPARFEKVLDLTHSMRLGWAGKAVRSDLYSRYLSIFPSSVRSGHDSLEYLMFIEATVW